ncbi:MAG: hypothetical protein ABUL68_03135 [Pseudomonadota bacterium]
MRNRVRIQPYISPDLRKRLQAYSAAQDVTESAIAEAALVKYLEPDRSDEALIVRRLDSVAQVLGRVEERLEIVAETVGQFIRFAFKLAPEKVPAGAAAHADGLVRNLLINVSRAVGTGTTFLPRCAAHGSRRRLLPLRCPFGEAVGREAREHPTPGR